MYNLLKTTVLGGVLFLVPVVVLIAILEKALGVAKKVVVPLNDALFQGTVHHAYMGDLLALALKDLGKGSNKQLSAYFKHK